jgi:hypothetical protein
MEMEMEMELELVHLSAGIERCRQRSTLAFARLDSFGSSKR